MPIKDSPTARVLITGGTGSLGRAVIGRLLAFAETSRVCSYARCEVRAAQLQAELGGHPALRVFVGDVRDQDRLERVLPGCETVIHAAALKRVDAGSYHPDEMLKTNVPGGAPGGRVQHGHGASGDGRQLRAIWERVSVPRVRGSSVAAGHRRGGGRAGDGRPDDPVLVDA